MVWTGACEGRPEHDCHRPQLEGRVSHLGGSVGPRCLTSEAVGDSKDLVCGVKDTGRALRSDRSSTRSFVDVMQLPSLIHDP